MSDSTDINPNIISQLRALWLLVLDRDRRWRAQQNRLRSFGARGKIANVVENEIFMVTLIDDEGRTHEATVLRALETMQHSYVERVPYPPGPLNSDHRVRESLTATATPRGFKIAGPGGNLNLDMSGNALQRQGEHVRRIWRVIEVDKAAVDAPPVPVEMTPSVAIDVINGDPLADYDDLSIGAVARAMAQRDRDLARKIVKLIAGTQTAV